MERLSSARCQQCGHVAPLWRVQDDGQCLHLCAACARRYLLRISPSAAYLWARRQGAVSANKAEQRCSHCFTDASVVRERGLTGCAQCYQQLSSAVADWLHRCQLPARHKALPLVEETVFPQEPLKEAAWLHTLKPLQIALSSRARYARNFLWARFPWCARQEELDEVRRRVERAVCHSESLFEVLPVERMGFAERRRWVEQRLASPLLQEGVLYGSLIVDQARTVSILVNEEDHLRVQAVLPGLRVRESLALARQVLENLALHAELAFSENYGWLTASVWNVGWGLRTSVMMYTPALERTGQLRAVWEAAMELGGTVRGLYGEGTPLGALFQVSNAHSIDVDEAVLAAQVVGTAQFIAQAEQRARQHLLNTQQRKLQEEAEALYHNLRKVRSASEVDVLQVLTVVSLGAMAGWARLDGALWKQMLLTAGWGSPKGSDEWRIWKMQQLVRRLRDGS